MKKLFTLLTLLVVAITASAASYIPTTVNAISANTLILPKDLTGNETWVNIPSKTLTDKALNPTEWDTDFGATQPSSNVKCLQVKADGGVYNSSKRVIHMLVSGITGVKAIGQANSGRGFQIGATEYIPGTTTESTAMTVVAGSTAALNPVSYSGLDASKTYIVSIFAYDKDTYLYGVYFTAASAGPSITTQPQSAAYATGDPIAALTVEATASAGDLEYQWYTCDDADKTNAAAIDGATSASYTPTVAGFYYVNVADENGDIDSDVAEITISAPEAPTINVTGAPASDVLVGTEVILTAETTGTPTPTVTWYDGDTDEQITTGASYTVPTDVAGTFSFYAVASNGVEPDATSDVVTLTVTNPDKYVTGNAYYISEDEVAVAGEKIYADDITATIVNYSGAAPTADTSLSGINPNYVAQITGSNNGWGPEFVATKNGTLSVGVIINGGKTFTLTNVTSFDYNGVQDEGSNTTSANAGTNESNTWAPSKKQWTVLTFDVVAGTTYKLSVAGSKMGFYGFEFTPAAATETITIPEAGVLTYVTQNAVDFSTIDGDIKAYAVTATSTSSAKTAEVGAVAAGTPLLIKGTAGDYDVEIVASGETPSNLLQVSDGSVTGGDNIYAYSKTLKKFKKVSSSITIPAGKCYLEIEGIGGDALDIIFDGEATAITNVNVNDNANYAPVKVITAKGVQIGKFNVAGQQVK